MIIKVKLIVLFALLSSKALSVELPIVDTDVCTSIGNYLRYCGEETRVLNAERVPEYVPLETKITIHKNTHCASPNALYLDIFGDNALLSSFDVRVLDTATVAQSSHATITASTRAPAANYTRFRKLCVMSADITANHINIPMLKNNMTVLKISTLAELNDVSALADQQAIIIELSSIVNLLSDVVEVAENDINQFYNLSSELLTTACSDGLACSWSSVIKRILDENFFSNFSQAMLLFNFGQQMDQITPESCFNGTCVAELLSDDIIALIAETTEKVPSTEAAQAQLNVYLSRKRELEILIDTYRADASYYGGIDWDSL